MLLGIWEREIAIAMLPHEAIISLIYKSCLLVQDVEILNLVLERLQPTFTYFKHIMILTRKDKACNSRSSTKLGHNVFSSLFSLLKMHIDSIN